MGRIFHLLIRKGRTFDPSFALAAPVFVVRELPGNELEVAALRVAIPANFELRTSTGRRVKVTEAAAAGASRIKVENNELRLGGEILAGPRLDLTGKTYRAEVRASYGGALLLDLAPTVANGVITLNASAAATGALAANCMPDEVPRNLQDFQENHPAYGASYVWELVQTQGATVRPVRQGRVLVVPGVF